MPRSDRLFELIQILRAASGIVTAQALSSRVEVSVRTVYRDIASLMAMGVPVEGAAGVGYLLRPGYDLPPLAFTAEELAAIRVGLGLLARTGDSDLIAAAGSAREKIAAENSPPQEATAYVSDWGATRLPVHRMALIREAIATERALDLIYRDSFGGETSRRIWPLAVVYYAEADILACWCCLRSGLRHFRADRMERLVPTDETFSGKGRRLRDEWRASQRHLMSDSVGLGSLAI